MKQQPQDRFFPPHSRAKRDVMIAMAVAFFVSSAAPGQESGGLPWETVPAMDLASPAEPFRRFGIGPDHLRRFRDGLPFDSAERELLWELLYRVKQLRASQLRTSVRWPLGEPANSGAPSRFRGRPFLLTGQALWAQRLTLPPDTLLRHEFEHYYRIQLKLDQAAKPATVWLRAIPKQWPLEVRLSEPVRLMGVFIKHGTAENGSLFVASRMGWFPNRVDVRLGTRSGHVLLAELGMDIALLDDVRDRNRKSISVAEKECFYRLLWAVGKAPSGVLNDRARTPLNVGPLLQNPVAHHGDLHIVQGAVRRITKVAVSDDDIQRRFGVETYYQIDLFAPLKNQVIKFGTSDAEGQDAAPTFSGSYPVTVCVLDLPAGLSEGENLRQEVRVVAAFWRLWAYKSQYVSSFNDGHLQLAPMFIGAKPALVEYPRKTHGVRALLVGGGFLAVLAAIWILSWRTSRRDKWVARSRRGMRLED